MKRGLIKKIAYLLIIFSLLLPLKVDAEVTYDTIDAYKEVDHSSNRTSRQVNELGCVMFVVFTYGYIKMLIYAIKEFKNE